MTIQDLEQWCGPDRELMVLYDRVYDVRGFAKKHPGGSISDYLINQDATDAFEAFHVRSKVPKVLLSTLPSLSLPEYYVARRVYDSSKGDREGEIPTAPSTPDSMRPKTPEVTTPSATQGPSPGDLDAHKEFDGALASKRTVNVLQKFREFRQQLEDEGHFKPSYSFVVYRVFEVAFLFWLHFYLLSKSLDITFAPGNAGRVSSFLFGYMFVPGVRVRWGYLIASLVAGGLGGGRCGWIQHEGGHASLTGHTRLDRFIQKITIGFGLICYDGKWNNMHNRHHAVPQKEDQDPDLDTLPFLATYEPILFRGRRRHLVKHMAWWLKYQHYSFFVLTSVINVFFWHFYLHPREYLFRKPNYQTLFLVLSRYVVHYYVSFGLFGTMGAFSTLSAAMFLSGIYLFGNFSLNHTFMPALPKEVNKNWVDQQMDHTLNIYPSIPVNWWMGYLNCQIEHHLFPNMPQFRQPGITKRTKAFCESVGIKYISVGYFEAVRRVYTNLRDISFRIDAHKEHYTKPAKRIQSGSKTTATFRPNIAVSETELKARKVEFSAENIDTTRKGEEVKFCKGQ